jgi:hypothetical protein
MAMNLHGEDGVITSSHPISISNRHVSTNSSLLSLHATSTSSSAIYRGNMLELVWSSDDEESTFIKGSTDGIVMFELSTTGYMKHRGAKILSGGVHIDAGGLHVDAGGIRVKGGLIVESRGLELRDQQFTASKIAAVSSELGMPLIEAKTQSDYFIGNVVNLEAQSNLDFNYISAQRKGQEVFKVNHNGDIITRGDIRVDGQIDIRNDLSLGGRLFVEHASVIAGDIITIPESSIYIEIVDDGAVKHNRLLLPSSSSVSPLTVGQIIVLTNMDADTTSGLFRIPFNTSVVLVHNGVSWRSIDALKVSIKVCTLACSTALYELLLTMIV